MLCYCLQSQNHGHHASAVARQLSDSHRKKRVGSTTESWVYTPNNRCRPEAPLTSLPKLTPVKNVEDNRRVGGEEKGRTTQDKNHKRQKQRDDGQSRDTAS